MVAMSKNSEGSNLTMSNTSDGEAELLSALADGELDAHQVALACAHWHPGNSAHATWLAYHLIGDVLRSEDLASSPRSGHAAFERFCERLAREPVVLAPAPALHGVAASRSRRKPWSWVALSAVAAGFAAVGGVLLVLGGPSADSQDRAAQVAQSGAAAPITIGGTASLTSAQSPQLLFADGKLVRDARLDRYLEAHKHFSGVSALGVPSTFLRGATSDASNR